MVNKINKLQNYIARKIRDALGVNKLKQEALLYLALSEVGIDYRNLVIHIDHVNGKNIINGTEFPIIYPNSFWDKVENLNINKKYKYYFNGNMAKTGGRKELLNKFIGENSRIIESEYGRHFFNKSRFNKIYFNGLSMAEFGLCPHHKDFVGNEKTMWTYRFIECCMVRTLPIIFVDAPLGSEFTDGFSFYMDRDFEATEIPFNMSLANENFMLAKERFSLNTKKLSELNKIKKMRSDSLRKN